MRRITNTLKRIDEFLERYVWKRCIHIFLIAHIICAIVFLGYIFADVILLSPVRKNLKKILSEEKQEVLDAVFGGISKRAVKIMPLCLLILILSGGAMISSYIGTEKGFFETKLQIF